MSEVSESTITAKGQTTVPAEVRQKMHVTTGTRLVWSVTADGTVVVRPKTKSILELAGSLTAPKGKSVTIDDLNAWR